MIYFGKGVFMANLQLKDINEKLYESLRSLAAYKKRSISQEVVYILQKYLSKPNDFEPHQTDEFLKLSDSWSDEKEAEERIHTDLEETMNYLIDTDILIYSLKGREKVIENFRAHRNYPKSILVITNPSM